MSGVNITILEGGKAENFGQVTKLRTSNGTDHDLWVPKSDVETKHLSVKKNGLHYTNQYTPTASEKKEGKFHDVYGWDTITVSVKKKAKGKSRKTSPRTGLEYDAPISVDVDDDGNLVETELPVYIEIDQPPDKLEYRDGENISKTGMVVKAYYADDREWGTVPNSDITLEPSVAEGGGTPIYNVSTQYEHLCTYKATGWPRTRTMRKMYDGAAYFAFVRCTTERYQNRPLMISTDPSSVYVQYQEEGSTDWSNSTSVGSYVYNGTRYWYNFPAAVSGDLEYCDVPVYGEFLTAQLAVETLVAIIDAGGTGGTQTITVGWTPPEGEEELTDTFDITVIPSN